MPTECGIRPRSGLNVGVQVCRSTRHVMNQILGSSSLCVLVFAAAVVKFTPLSDSDSNKRVEIGDAIVLYCEVSHPFANVSWFKDGQELQVSEGLNIQSDGNMRRIVIPSADASHSGIYTCQTLGDVITFDVDVAGKKKHSYETDKFQA